MKKKDALLDAMIDVSICIYMYTFNYSLIHPNYLSICFPLRYNDSQELTLVGGQFVTSILNQAPDLFKEILVTLTEVHRSILQSTVMLTIQSQQQQQQQTVGLSQSYPSRPNEFNNITDNKTQILNNSNNNSTSNKPVMKMMINMDKYKK